MIRDTLTHIATQYLAAKQENFTENPIANYLRHDAPAAIASALANELYLCKGSAGQGLWADVPWIGIYNPNITTGARNGYYVVYLFDADMEKVHLVLGQGVTSVREEFGSATDDALARFAGIMRDRLPEAKGRFSSKPIVLRGKSTQARDYETSIALSASYNCSNLPAEEVLQADLRDMTKLYALLFSRGGRDNYADSETEETEGAGETVVERRRYRQHRKIERNPKAAKLAKKEHGYICQCCGFDFEAIFGPSGKEYIEAHHLKPLAELPEDVPVSQDPKTDFAVLCANCHRMIHRKDAPKTVGELRQLARVENYANALRQLLET
jgi:5-methylcytosine-specific restriction protein A